MSALVLAACGGGSAGDGSEGTETAGDATTTSGETPDEWVIGWINPLSGSAAAFGELSTTAIDIAVEQINDDGGINGVPLDVVYEDNEFQVEASVTAMQALNDQEIDLVISAGSSVIFALDPVAEQNEQLLANIAAQSPQLLTDTGEQTFNFIPTSAAEVERLAALARERLELNSVAVLHVDNDYGQDTSDAFVDAWEAEGGEVVARETNEVGATDMRAQLIQIREAQPDAVAIISNVAEVGHAVQQARELGIEAELLGATFALSPDNYEIAGDAMNGMRGVAVAFRPEGNPEAQEFATEFTDRLDEEPTIYAAASYDAVNILAQGIEETGTDDPEAIAEYLLGVENYPGVLGETSFTDQRTVEIPLFEWQFEGGEPVAWED